jgi:hypothetical protein
MTSYIISYELHDKHREPALLAALEIFEDRIHALASMWFVCSPWSADQIRSHLARYLGPDDSLVVEKMPMGQGWSGWIGDDVREWLEKHLGPSS